MIWTEQELFKRIFNKSYVYLTYSSTKMLLHVGSTFQIELQTVLLTILKRKERSGDHYYKWYLLIIISVPTILGKERKKRWPLLKRISSHFTGLIYTTIAVITVSKLSYDASHMSLYFYWIIFCWLSLCLQYMFWGILYAYYISGLTC